MVFFKGRWVIRATEMMETNKKIMLMMTKIIINMVNDDNDNVQPLDNFSIEIANGHS